MKIIEIKRKLKFNRQLRIKLSAATLSTSVLGLLFLSFWNEFLFIEELLTVIFVVGMLFTIKTLDGSGKKIASYEKKAETVNFYSIGGIDSTSSLKAFKTKFKIVR